MFDTFDTFDFLFAAAIIAVIVILVGVAQIIRERRIVPNKYEWLCVLSPAECKDMDRIAKEMSRRKNATVGGAIMRGDLESLEEEEFVKSGLAMKKMGERDVAVMGYKLTHAGLELIAAGEM